MERSLGSMMPPVGLGEVPDHTPSPEVLGHVELLLDGVYGPGRTMSVDVTTDLARRATAAGALVLTDEEGAPLARLAVGDATAVAGVGTTRLTGQVTPLRDARPGPFGSLREPPARLRDRLGATPTLALATARPLLASEEAAIAAAADARGARVLVLPYLLLDESPGPPAEVLVRAVR